MPAAQARVLPLNGASNCRDLGGYRGRDGRLVRWRRLLRSDHLAGLSDADRSTLRELGLAVTMRADGRRAVGIAHRRGGARVSEPDGCTLWIDGWWRACCDVHDMAFISGSVDLDTHLERAARFLYLQRLAFGGKIVGRSFGVDRCGPGRFDVRKLGPMLEGIHERMAGVVIENLDFEAFIRRSS